MHSKGFVARKGRRETRPWAEWLSGKEHVIVRGKDFDNATKLGTMIVVLRRKGWQKEPGGRITAEKIGDSAIKFRYIAPGEAEGEQ